MKTMYSMFAGAGLILASACSGPSDNPHRIRVGITSGPEQDLARVAATVAKETYGLDVELITFHDYVIPNEALNNGELDVNAFQHRPYLEEQARQRGYNLAVVGNTFVYPIVAYSKKISGLSELKSGSTVVIPNDPSNGGRALLLFREHGLLKFREGVGLLPRLTDIVENPLQLKILEIEAPQLPRVLDDREVTLAVINNNFAAQAGLDAGRYGILKEGKASPYVNVIVSRTGNQHEEKVRNFVKAYQSEAVSEAAERIFKGAAVKGW
jgi:D-methionine transport system substrate-binding protein